MRQKIASVAVIAMVVIAVAAVVAGLFLFPYSPNQPPNADDVGSTEQGRQEVVNANNQFAFDLYLKYKNDSKYQNKNVFFSPYSISTALAMTYEGAKGQTAEEMRNVFHFPEFSILRPNSAAIYNGLNKLNSEYKLNTANALWAQRDYQFLNEYLLNVEKYYGGKTANLDFIRESENSRATINKWVEKQTNDKIKDLIPKGVIDELTRLVLTNAIYFKGTWEWEFAKSDTNEQDFKITPDSIVKVPMMYMKPDKAEFNYADLEDLQILELPYKGNDISMLVLLPKENLDAVESSLTSEKFNEYKAQMNKTKLHSIYLPKFKFDTKYFMTEILEQMGMPTAFTDDADFSGMDGTRDLFISNVIHQAFVQVDEEGTEAAAATAVVVEIQAIDIQNIFNADHPFIFIIQEKATGNILFLGRVSNPAG